MTILEQKKTQHSPNPSANTAPLPLKLLLQQIHRDNTTCRQFRKSASEAELHGTQCSRSESRAANVLVVARVCVSLFAAASKTTVAAK